MRASWKISHMHICKYICAKCCNPRYIKSLLTNLLSYLLFTTGLIAIFKYLCILIHIWIKGEVGAVKPFKPSSKIFYWPFQGGTSFVDLLCFCSVLCLLCLCARLFICALWSPAGKGLTSWLSFVVSAVSLSLSHWYPGSGVVLDCIDSWSLHPYLLSS